MFNDDEWHDPVLAFGLLITATLILFIMYLPKVRKQNMSPHHLEIKKQQVVEHIEHNKSAVPSIIILGVALNRIFH